MKKKKLINVCGTARSGSTMVDLMLGNDQRAFSLGEMHAWFRPFRSHHFRIICSCEQNNCPWRKLKEIKENEFYKKCFEILNVDILVDSSKNLPWVIDNNIQAGKDGIAVYNILLYKDPVSLFYSFWKRGLSVESARRNEFIKYYERFFMSNLPYISLNYNKLIADPSTTLNELCQILGIPYYAGKENFWEKQHHHLFGSMGTRKQVGRPNSEIRKSEEYPAEFKRIIPKIEAENVKNRTLQRVVSKLKSHEMRKIECPNEGIRKPYWYYFLKIKQKIRRYFPQGWNYSQ
jgi:hypothetical protein